MDLRVHLNAAFAPPHSFELCGKNIDLSADGMKMLFGGYPSREVVIDDKVYTYECSKVADGVFSVVCRDGTGTCGAFALDSANGCVYGVTKSFTSGGVLVSDSIIPHFVARDSDGIDDIAGNTVDWVFSPKAETAVRLNFSKRVGAQARRAKAELSFPKTSDSSIIQADYSAARIREGIYVMDATADISGAPVSALIIADFKRVTGAGVVYGVKNTEPFFRSAGCYGRVISYEE